MQNYDKKTQFYVPDQVSFDKAIKRTTHMGIMAHHDDLEIAAYDGILKCFLQKDKWFFGVVVTDGSGSARGGLYENYTNDQMQEIRTLEQKKAALIGGYGLQAFLNASSKDTKDPHNKDIIEEIKHMILDAKPEVVYTHNLADKHDTHIGVVTKVIKAIRGLKQTDRPKQLYACEVWRDLDWMGDDEKISFDVGGKPNLAAGLIEVFDSQIDGTKRYDLGTIGRRYANATYANAYRADRSDSVILGMDLTPLILDDDLDVSSFITDAIDRFKGDVKEKIKRIG